VTRSALAETTDNAAIPRKNIEWEKEWEKSSKRGFIVL